MCGSTLSKRPPFPISLLLPCRKSIVTCTAVNRRVLPVLPAPRLKHRPILSHRGMSLLHPDWVRRSIRPPTRGDHEYVNWFGSATELWIQHDGRVGQICTPNGAVHGWRVKQQASKPVGGVTLAPKATV